MTSDGSRRLEGGDMEATKTWLESYPAQVPASVSPIPDVGLHQLLVDAARRHPHAPALAWFGKHIRYAELGVRSSGSPPSASLGVRKGDRVALILRTAPNTSSRTTRPRLGRSPSGTTPVHRARAHAPAHRRGPVRGRGPRRAVSGERADRGAGIHSTIVTSVTHYMPFLKKHLAPIAAARAGEGRPWPPVPPGARSMGCSADAIHIGGAARRDRRRAGPASPSTRAARRVCRRARC
jgi:hypothetical protein